MEDNYNMQNTPIEGTPEHDEYMRNQFGDDYELGYRVGFGRRLGAYLLDLIFTGIVGVIVFMVTGTFQVLMQIDNIFENLDQFALAMQDTSIISLVLVLLYYSTEVFFAASPGKMLLNIQIGNDNRTHSSISTLINRFLIKHSNSILSILSIVLSVYWLDALGNIIIFVLIVGFFFTLSKKRQAFHDMLTGTAVYYKDNIKNY